VRRRRSRSVDLRLARADIKNILEFERDYPDAKVVRLEQNYRSTKTILAIADRLIANNTQRKQKSLWTENADGEKVKLVLCQDEHDEAASSRRLPIASRQAEARLEPHGDLLSHERAVARDGRCAAPAKVPYQIARGVEFYNRKEIKDVLAYLRVLANPADEVSLERIINVPTRGIGDSSIKQIQAFAIAHGLTFWNTLEVITTVTASPRARSIRSTSSSR
jgi:DNA helicase-2/ATP-dependent DNA helicase PcrA